MPKRRTITERAKYLSAEEAAVALGVNTRALKRRIAAGDLTPPAMYASEGRYLFTRDELQRAREELGLGGAGEASEQSYGKPDRATLEEFARIGRSLDPTPRFAELALATDLSASFKDSWADAMRSIDPATLFPTYDRLTEAREALSRRMVENQRVFESMSRQLREAQAAREPIRPAVAPGQVGAFSDAVGAAMEVQLRELLGELRETNRLLRALIETRATNPEQAMPGPMDWRGDEPEGGSTYRG